MTDLLSLWREARGPEPDLPGPLLTHAGECEERGHWFSADQMHAHYAAAVTEDALSKFAAAIRAEERERCARLSETLTLPLDKDAVKFSKHLAAAIRAQA
jgi:hypothetical protein